MPRHCINIVNVTMLSCGCRETQNLARPARDQDIQMSSRGDGAGQERVPAVHPADLCQWHLQSGVQGRAEGCDHYQHGHPHPDRGQLLLMAHTQHPGSNPTKRTQDRQEVLFPAPVNQLSGTREANHHQLQPGLPGLLHNQSNQ